MPSYAAGSREPKITIVDMDLISGTVDVSGPDRGRASAPGSTLKPFVLLTAMRLGIVRPQTRIACTGSFALAGRNLTCAHPTSLGVLDAQEALAYSCNRYFARTAQQLTAATLQQGLQQFGFRVSGAIVDPDDRALTALGLEGIQVTPLQLATDYARLAKVMEGSDSAMTVLRSGLVGSVSYGMAHAAQTPPLVIAGKTGTAHDPAPMLQHGWFAGIVFAAAGKKPLRTLVVYAPGGNGNDAAVAAHRYLQSRLLR